MRADDLLAELLNLLDLSGEVVGEGVLEGLFRGGLASEPSIETGSGVISGPTHLGLRGRVASRTVQSGGLDGLCDRRPQSGGTDSKGGGHIDSSKTEWNGGWREELGG